MHLYFGNLAGAAVAVHLAGVVLGVEAYRRWPAEFSNRSPGIPSDYTGNPSLQLQQMEKNILTYRGLRQRIMLKIMFALCLYYGLVSLAPRERSLVLLGSLGVPVLVLVATWTRRAIVEHVRFGIETGCLERKKKELHNRDEQIRRQLAFIESPAEQRATARREAEWKDKEAMSKMFGYCPQCDGTGHGAQYGGTVGGNAIHGASHACHPCYFCNGTGKYTDRKPG